MAVVDAGVHIRIGPEPSSIALEGELDVLTVPDVESVLDAVDADAMLVIDLAETMFVSAAAITVFLRAAGRRQRAGGQLVLTNVRPSCRRVFEITDTAWLLA